MSSTDSIIGGTMIFGGSAANLTSFDDVSAKIAEMVHAAYGSPTAWVNLDDDAKEKKISNAKRDLNEHAASSMTKARLDEVDPDGHVNSWFAGNKKFANF